MMVRVSTPGFLAGFFVAAVAAPLLSTSPVFAQSEITVFAPYRGIATPIARAGSAVSVITREEIEQAGQNSVAEILRASPGVSFNSSGGFGSSTDVRIRGAESQHTMVLIDGVPVSDTTSTRNAFDFTMLPVGSIERIEVLRGPQSALYGSDAIGGVIAITTRQPTRGLSGSASVEGGSFGTHREASRAGYGGDQFSITGYAEHFSTQGYSRRAGNDEADGSRQWTGGLRGQANLSENLSLDAAFQVTDLETNYDRSNTDPEGEADRLSITGHARATHESFDGRWRQTVTAFASSTDRSFVENADVDDYNGNRIGMEYTGEIRWDALGTTLYGLTGEQQSAEYVEVSTVQFDEDELYWGAFAMQQFSIGPALHLSAAVRFDDFADAGTFVTGRGTAVYELHETETRFHGSVGTGAKAPSLRQRAATPNLRPEESWGADIGITQTLFDGRLTVDVTGFYQEIEDLHVYTGGFGSFALEAWENIDEARLMGIEVTADARVIPGHVDASAHYAYLDAEDATTGDRLQRRPEHEAQVTLSYIGIDRLRVSGVVNWVGGERFSRSRERDPLDPYTRVDVTASYQAHEHLEIYGRIENLFDVEYEEINGYNTPRLSAYAGIRATF
ncbi:MAG: TonB-dependent receptor plug domain-containing protein [Hyphomicrobiales bacterium]